MMYSHNITTMDTPQRKHCKKAMHYPTLDLYVTFQNVVYTLMAVQNENFFVVD